MLFQAWSMALFVEVVGLKFKLCKILPLACKLVLAPYIILDNPSCPFNPNDLR